MTTINIHAGELTQAHLGATVEVAEASLDHGTLRWKPGTIRIAMVTHTTKGTKVRPGRAKIDPPCGHTDYDFDHDDLLTVTLP